MRTRLKMGSVARVVMLFKERWWTKKLSAAPSDASLDALSFIHGGLGDFPTWWTLAPDPAPILTGWAAAQRAERMAGLPAMALVQQGIESLAARLQMLPQTIEALAEGAWVHDWQGDPFARGVLS